MENFFFCSYPHEVLNLIEDISNCNSRISQVIVNNEIVTIVKNELKKNKKMQEKEVVIRKKDENETDRIKSLDGSCNDEIPIIQVKKEDTNDIRVKNKRQRNNDLKNMEIEPNTKKQKVNQNNLKRKKCNIMENVFENPNLEKRSRKSKKKCK